MIYVASDNSYALKLLSRPMHVDVNAKKRHDSHKKTAPKTRHKKRRRQTVALPKSANEKKKSEGRKMFAPSRKPDGPLLKIGMRLGHCGAVNCH